MNHLWRTIMLTCGLGVAGNSLAGADDVIGKLVWASVCPKSDAYGAFGILRPDMTYALVTVPKGSVDEKTGKIGSPTVSESEAGRMFATLLSQPGSVSCFSVLPQKWQWGYSASSYFVTGCSVISVFGPGK